jgi:hypothetical protein
VAGLAAGLEIHADTVGPTVTEKAAMQQKLSKCILHIGTPKTGSTAIQRFLEANYDVLSRRNITADVKLANDLAKAFTLWHTRTHFLRKAGLQDQQKHAQLKRKAVEALHEIVSSEANAKKVVILSSETFYMMPEHNTDIIAIKEVLESYFETVDVVCFFRDPVDFVVSSYNQNLRGAYSGSLQAYIGKYIASSRWKYFSNYKIWSSVFGADRCCFVPFNADQQTNYDVVRHFCGLVNLDFEGLAFSQGKRFNPQMSAKLTAIYRLINMLVPLWKRGKGQQDVLNPANRKVKRFFKRLRFLAHGRKLRLTENQRQMVRSATYKEYRRMLDHYNAVGNAPTRSINETE